MTRTFALGDPQAPFAKTLEVLDLHGALAGDRLAADVALISIGDHFDYDYRDPATCAREGLATLRWLASHDPAQVTILVGNHDASRVMELATLTDDAFEEARLLARAVDAGTTTEAAFHARYPALPCSGVIGRDYASFTTEQRALVIELLLAGRMHLATTAHLVDGRTALLTHAGVTTRELDMLGIPGARDPVVIARRLESFLAEAVAAVRPAWERGERVPLSLAPLHVTGDEGREGGGLLYHRPSDPATSTPDPARPRRFDPRTLPVGLTQVVGHTGHAKATAELARWATDAARARKHGGIRTLRLEGDAFRYDLGVAPPSPGATDFIFIDGELRRVLASEVDLLPLYR